MTRGCGTTAGRVLIGLSMLAACSTPRRSTAPAEPPVGFAPQSAAFEVPFGGEATEDFRLTGAVDGRPALSVVSGGDPDLQVEALPAERGMNAGLRIHATGRKVGRRVGTLVVSTGLSAPAQVELLFSLHVRGTLSVSPTNPIIDLSRRGEKAVVIEVASTHSDFAVTAVEITSGPFAASFERSPAGANFHIRVTALTEQMAQGARGAVGTLVVRSNDVAEPRKEISLLAFGNAGAAR